jgi:hypothetical protein
MHSVVAVLVGLAGAVCVLLTMVSAVKTVVVAPRHPRVDHPLWCSS